MRYFRVELWRDGEMKHTFLLLADAESSAWNIQTELAPIYWDFMVQVA